ncbi:MAG: hypothetical protein ACREAA_06955 [Candidatus Polarisedimenticolia bacterium]
MHQDTERTIREDRSSGPPRGLLVLRRLLDALDREGIRYCHWKSNEHLFEGMVGMTDLDVLFDRAGTHVLDRIFGEAGFKRLLATPMRTHPGLEDYVGFDEATGSLVHLHVHHLLRMGEKNSKGYWLPWEELFLATRHVQQPEGMYASHPDAEMVIFFLRSALKSRLRDRVASWAGRDYTRGGLDREYRWLRQRSNPARVVALVRDLLGREASDVAAEMLSGAPRLRSLTRFRRASAPTLRRCRTHSPLVARVRRWTRELYGMRASLAKRITHPPTPMNRSLPSGGLVVAILGSDGSGKSTVVKEVARWLSWKVDVLTMYHGSGDGPASLIRWPMRAALRLARGGDGTRSSGGSGRKGFKRRLRPVWALALSLEKRRKLLKSWRARNRGMVVLCDRYPQNQVDGYNDGPLLGHWRDSPNVLLRLLARWEGSPYAWAERLPPDLVIKLHVSPEVASSRKPDMGPDEVLRRVETIRTLRYPASRVSEVNADAPLEEVLLKIKRDIWSVL